MELFHGSNSPVTRIERGGLFDGIFACASAQAACSHGDMLHVVTSPRPLDDYSLNYELSGAYDAALELTHGDEQAADAIMRPDCPDGGDADLGWGFQRLRGALAARLGYSSVEMRDEHGVSWLCLPTCTISRAD